MDAYRNTCLTFVVSGAMVSSALAASAQASGQFGSSQPDLMAPKLCAVDDASPLSSSSRFVALQGAGSITPSSVDSCVRSVSGSSQQRQLGHLISGQHLQQGVQQHLIQLQLPQQRQQAGVSLGGIPRAAPVSVGQQGAVKWPWLQQQQLLAQQQPQQQQAQQNMLPQNSGNSFSSTATSGRTSFPGSSSSSESFPSNTNSAAVSNTAWQQLLKHQQIQLVPAVRTLHSNTGSSQLGKRLAAPSSSCDQLPAAKRTATGGVAPTLLQTSLGQPWSVARPQAAQQPQQQLVLLSTASNGQPQVWQAARLPPSGFTRQQQQQRSMSLVPAASSTAAPTLTPAAAPVPALLRVLEPMQQKLLQWAGRVLNCQLQDAYLLGAHLYRRVNGQLDDMLLISLGVTASTESVTMLVSLWVASKLEGHRRQVAGASKLAAALQLLPGSITDIELHVMHSIKWQPYAGYAGRMFD